MNVQVGDIIKLENNQFVTVSMDMIVNCVFIMAFYSVKLIYIR